VIRELKEKIKQHQINGNRKKEMVKHVIYYQKTQKNGYEEREKMRHFISGNKGDGITKYFT
jgi:hypothetical protein